MSTPTSYELVWAAGVLECLPKVEMHGFSAFTETLWFFNPVRCSSEPVPVVTLHVEAAGIAAAQLLVEALALAESGEPRLHDDCFGLTILHIWSGWASEASREAAVRVEISASERVWTAEAVA